MKSSRSTKRGSVRAQDRELQYVFMQFHQKVTSAFRKEAKDMPFTIPQLEALRFVIEQKNPTMKDIASHLDVTAPSATAMIEQLSEKKLITRGFDSADRRTIHVFPTSKASKLFSLFAQIKARVFGEILSDLSSQDQKTLISILSKLI
jgi:DNA-binding MarR family transcriptional regulator